MNSEELERSLRTEFESYLKDVLAEMRQEISDFQEKVQTEIEKHKTQLDSVFQDFSSRLNTEKELEVSFKETVVEHLRLARDEGARITAEAITEAEELAKQSAPPASPQVSFAELRDALNDISRKDSQAEILTALVDHAARFTPRGAFFIVKNDYFVGWRVFGKEAPEDETTIREIFTPVDSDSVLGESVRSLTTVESNFGTYNDDSVYLSKLDFGQPDRMYAIPLIARGRGVAVLYADYGQEGTSVNLEALEALVNIAGLTVELLAAAPGTRPAAYKEVSKPAEVEKQTEPAEETQTITEEDIQAEPEQEATVPDQFAADEKEPVEETVQPQEDFQTVTDASSWSQPIETTENGYAPGVPTDDEAATVEPIVAEDEFVAPSDEQFEEVKAEEEVAAPSTTEVEEEESAAVETKGARRRAKREKIEVDEEPAVKDEPSVIEAPQFETTEEFAASLMDDFSAAKEPAFDSFEPVPAPPKVAQPVETVSQPSVSTQRVKTRFSDRNVDLPIEVAEDERRLHNDARRFARLLVSEIKLYNEQKVKEGRDASDLYERLREAIDRSREMYDKRVQPAVASKFDYFHYELVNSLAEGDEAKLGETYSGALV